MDLVYENTVTDIITECGSLALRMVTARVRIILSGSFTLHTETGIKNLTCLFQTQNASQTPDKTRDDTASAESASNGAPSQAPVDVLINLQVCVKYIII